MGSAQKMNNQQFIPPHPLKTAVLFLVFNRPETTKQVFEAIRKAKPPRLYVAADGARKEKNGDEEKVRQVREIATKIDWECEVKTLFRKENIGCGIAVSRAITWFFESEEQGIILEDDCLPSQSFFWFCEELLEKYKYDLRIWQVSGDNFQDGIKRGDADYYFSKYNHIWGWATWRNRWEEFDVEIKKYGTLFGKKIISSIWSETKLQNYWLKQFTAVYKGRIDIWDYQWTYTTWSNNGLTILPNINLISNIGFGADATHSKDKNSKVPKLNEFGISYPMKHPIFIISDYEADLYTNRNLFNQVNILRKIYRKIVQWIKRS